MSIPLPRGGAYAGTWAPFIGPLPKLVSKGRPERPPILVRESDGVLLLPVWREQWHPCLISPEDAWALGRNWFITPGRYVFCNKPGRKVAYLHRLIGYAVRHSRVPDLDTFFLPRRIEVDHNDRNPLNNTRRNLTLVDGTTNCYNRDPVLKPEGTGVSWDKNRECYYAKIKHEGRTIHIGRFDSQRRAEAAVETKRFILERARLRKIQNEEVPF